MSGVQAESAGVVWGMERSTFRSIIVTATMHKRQRYEDCLAAMPLFAPLTPDQRAAIADCLSLETFQVAIVMFWNVLSNLPAYLCCIHRDCGGGNSTLVMKGMLGPCYGIWSHHQIDSSVFL